MTQWIKYISICLLLTAGCAKQKYPDTVVENDAQYFVRGTLDGQPIQLAAGLDGYYMNTSFSTDTFGILKFQGKLQNNGCVGCGDAVTLELRDYREENLQVTMDSSFATGNRQLFSDDPEILVYFSGTSNRNGSILEWNFGDGGTASGNFVSHVFRRSSIYNVCVRSSSDSHCFSEACNMQNIRPGALLVNAGVTSVNGRKVYFNAAPHGTAPFTYAWSFGDGSFSDAPAPVHEYQIEGSYPVTLKVRDAEGNEATTVYNAVTQNDKSSCSVNYSVNQIIPLGKRSLSMAGLTWKKASGSSYTTAAAIQPHDGYFDIISAEPAGANESGVPIVRLQVKVNCNFSDGFNTINFKGEMAVAVAHP